MGALFILGEQTHLADAVPAGPLVVIAPDQVLVGQDIGAGAGHIDRPFPSDPQILPDRMGRAEILLDRGHGSGGVGLQVLVDVLYVRVVKDTGH